MTAQTIDPATRQAAAWFARLRADDVTGAERGAFEQWLGEDLEHRAAYESFERFWSKSGEYAADRKVAQEVRKLQRTVRPLQWAAAAAAVIIAAGTWLALTNNVYGTGVGEQRTIALEDGSRVTLNTDSRVRVRFSGGHRSIELLRGQAYFSIAKDAARPFSVETGEGSVRVLGTEFDVYRQDGTVQVTLVDGSVRVEGENDSTGSTLRPGERIELTSGKRGEVERVSLRQSQAWLSGKLVFDNEPLAAAVMEANRYSKQKILLGDASLGALRISGVFRAGEMDEFIHALTSYFPVSARKERNGSYALTGRK